MRLVDGEERDARCVEQREARGSRQALGRDVQEVERALAQRALGGASS
jgi:hypothetical protein